MNNQRNLPISQQRTLDLGQKNGANLVEKPLSFYAWFEMVEERYFWIDDVHDITEEQENQLHDTYLNYLRNFNRNRGK